MIKTQPANKDELSFGVELEFLFYFKVPERLALAGDPNATQNPDEIILDPAEDARLPPALTLPAEYDFDEKTDQGPHDDYYDGDHPRGWANKLVKQAILSITGARLHMTPMPAGTPKALQDMYVVPNHKDNHSGWSVKVDPTVQDADIKIQGYGWLNFEVTSPALYDRPESHTHVHRVVQELTKRFRLRVNFRTGFHVHVGAGLNPPSTPADEPTHLPRAGQVAETETEGEPRKHPLGVLRRAAALMWAADGFLGHAHPPDRGFNVYSAPARFFSCLAWGQEKRFFRNAHGGMFHRVEEMKDVPFAAPAGGEHEEEALPSRRFLRVDAERRFPAVRGRKPSDEVRRRYKTMNDHGPLKVKPKGGLAIEGMYAGIGHIMRCKNRAEIAELLATARGAGGFGRLNYNLSSYQGMHAATATVEYREATGTMSADWVAVWSSVCLGIFRFARDASEERFWAVIAQLAKAEAAAGSDQPEQQQKQQYDMISLLFDMGLFTEGLFLERKLRADPMGFWFPCRLVEGKEDPWYDGGSSSENPSESYSWVQPPSGGWEDGVQTWTGSWEDQAGTQASNWEDEVNPLTGQSSAFVQSPAMLDAEWSNR